MRCSFQTDGVIRHGELLEIKDGQATILPDKLPDGLEVTVTIPLNDLVEAHLDLAD